LLRRPQVSYESLLTLPGAGVGQTDPQVIEQIEIQTKYQGYIERQHEEVKRAVNKNRSSYLGFGLPRGARPIDRSSAKAQPT